ncbi:hypothetical protein GLYMA_17G140850v4 [Glycine max]|nr:hypothetical protein GLYMA_17G140850v4 [Glycine max]KAH1118409.1 hypothetical protein GYH30_047247 [Glycine max]
MLFIKHKHLRMFLGFATVCVFCSKQSGSQTSPKLSTLGIIRNVMDWGFKKKIKKIL